MPPPDWLGERLVAPDASATLPPLCPSPSSSRGPRLRCAFSPATHHLTTRQPEQQPTGHRPVQTGLGSKPDASRKDATQPGRTRQWLAWLPALVAYSSTRIITASISPRSDS